MRNHHSLDAWFSTTTMAHSVIDWRFPVICNFKNSGCVQKFDKFILLQTWPLDRVKAHNLGDGLEICRRSPGILQVDKLSKSFLRCSEGCWHWGRGYHHHSSSDHCMSSRHSTATEKEKVTDLRTVNSIQIPPSSCTPPAFFNLDYNVASTCSVQIICRLHRRHLFSIGIPFWYPTSHIHELGTTYQLLQSVSNENYK